MYSLSARVTRPRFYLLSAYRALAPRYELYARAVRSVAALSAADLTKTRGVFCHVVFRAEAGSIAGVAPLVHGVKARTDMSSAVRAALSLEIKYIGVCLRSLTVVTGRSAVIYRLRLSYDDPAAVSVVGRRLFDYRRRRVPGALSGVGIRLSGFRFILVGDSQNGPVIRLYVGFCFRFPICLILGNGCDGDLRFGVVDYDADVRRSDFFFRRVGGPAASVFRGLLKVKSSTLL